MDAPKDVNSELESFREQWRAEVRAKKPAAASSQKQTSSSNGHAGPANSKQPAAPAPPRPTTHPSSGKPKLLDPDDDDVEPLTFDDPVPIKAVPPSNKDDGDLVTALDHYERAVERESQGSLGDSLMLYRKAFRVCFTAYSRS